MNSELKTMEPQTPKEFLEQKVPQRFKPEKAAGIDVTAQLNLTGPMGGSWIIKIKDQKISIKEGTEPSATLTLQANDNDFMDMVNHKLSAEAAFFTGKIKFKGNLGIALKLRDAGIL
jgi:putative sterol carrier protein